MITNSGNIPFQTINWEQVETTAHDGDSGVATWRTVQFPGLRIRLVRYSKGYTADHWCKLGHVIHCLDGEFVSEMRDGRTFRLTKGMSYIVSDELSEHRSTSANGADLLIIDGDFLKKPARR
jgi:hypothetical protein